MTSEGPVGGSDTIDEIHSRLAPEDDAMLSSCIDVFTADLAYSLISYVTSSGDYVDICDPGRLYFEGLMSVVRRCEAGWVWAAHA